ncbi:MAG: 1-(5-phosphoribosyl)-5-[(5-phosphoribosylamino)methylideneamino]imidazole-4-carboxamide isomerase [Bacteroidales bacterium]|nr:1-(5-phosphoribosyl)-5-[(5-phosphoribosylamino)methylideneamino]imidazole-4-carboxamide isomerase [Bacteroidales bacterium]
MIEIIPAIDIIGGKCVRLSRGDYDQKKVYNDNPLEVARRFADVGCKRLHLVDLDGAASQHIVNYRILEMIATHTPLTIDFGGGLKSDEDVRIAFESGAKMITGGSIAVKNPMLFEHWIKAFGSERVILGADANHGKIVTMGWRETSQLEIVPFIRRYTELGIKKVISTDTECDGMLSGPSLESYRKILEEIPNVYLIASGGVSGMGDIEALGEMNIPEVIVGKAIYEGRITLADIEKHNLLRKC